MPCPCKGNLGQQILDSRSIQSPSTYLFQLPWERLTVVKPVPEAVEAMLDEVFGGSKVEPRIDCHLFQYGSPLANHLFTITLMRASKRY